MVSVSGAAGFSDVPLLPYERQLIAALGCTVEEYKDYRKRLINAGTTRPAGYESIPDVRCDPVSILVSLAVGLVLTGVSYLLAPKPKEPEKDERNQKRLASDSGPQRFNSTSGFDTIQQIAEFGQTIPLLFGRYNPNEFTGGLSTAPRLVWSRMFSHGSHQGFKGIYAVGEALGDLNRTEGSDEADRPEISGIQFGTNPLDSQAPEKYAIYWNPRLQGGRITAADLLYGTRAYPAAGDPETTDDCFLVPLTDYVAAGPQGFCMANASNGNQDFGVYGAIPNGTAYLVNWKVVSIPDIDGKDDEDGRLRAERLKIAGKYGMDIGDGMRGTGRGYATMMGIKSCTGQGESQTPVFNVRVDVGDELDFVIRSEQLRGTGLILDSVEEFVDIANSAPVASHFGDFVLGFPAALENTQFALSAGSTVIGNLGQYFTFRLPGWLNDIETTRSTLTAIALMAAQPVDVLVHSNLDDGFAAVFNDLSCALGAAIVEKYLIEELMGEMSPIVLGTIIVILCPALPFKKP